MHGTAERSDATAKLIYQDHLDALTRAMMERDFECFAARMAIPHHVRTENMEFWVESREAMEATFQQVHESQRKAGVTDVVRLVQSAEFVSDREIVGRHVTHKLQRAQHVIPPFQNRIRLCRDPDDGVWRETHCANGLHALGGVFGLDRMGLGKISEAPALGKSTKRERND